MMFLDLVFLKISTRTITELAIWPIRVNKRKLGIESMDWIHHLSPYGLKRKGLGSKFILYTSRGIKKAIAYII